MRILLVGEYSRLHNSLKKGLIELGHDVIIIGTQDGFKYYPVDIMVSSIISRYSITKKLTILINKIFKINLLSIENAIQWHLKTRKLKGFDIVQLYNESIAKTYPFLEK